MHLLYRHYYPHKRYRTGIISLRSAASNYMGTMFLMVFVPPTTPAYANNNAESQWESQWDWTIASCMPLFLPHTGQTRSSCLLHLSSDGHREDEIAILVLPFGHRLLLSAIKHVQFKHYTGAGEPIQAADYTHATVNQHIGFTTVL